MLDAGCSAGRERRDRQREGDPRAGSGSGRSFYRQSMGGDMHYLVSAAERGKEDKGIKHRSMRRDTGEQCFSGHRWLEERGMARNVGSRLLLCECTFFCLSGGCMPWRGSVVEA